MPILVYWHHPKVYSLLTRQIIIICMASLLTENCSVRELEVSLSSTESISGLHSFSITAHCNIQEETDFVHTYLPHHVTIAMYVSVLLCAPGRCACDEHVSCIQLKCGAFHMEVCMRMCLVWQAQYYNNTRTSLKTHHPQRSSLER